MNDPGNIASPLHGPRELIAISSVYFSTFNEIAKAPRASRGRITPIVTLIALISAALEVDDILTTRLSVPDLKNRVLDNIYRGSDYDLRSCLRLLENYEYVKLSFEQKRTNKSHECQFLPKFEQKVQEFTKKLCEMYNVERRLDPVTYTLIIFDYFCFRFLPEWYLLIRIVLRSAGILEETRAKLHDGLFRIQSWLALNFFLLERNKEGANLNSNTFRDNLGNAFSMGNGEPTEIVDGLIASSFLRNDRGGLTLVPTTERFVVEYEKIITSHFQGFLETLRGRKPE
jgi:hypothetical protein